MSDPEELPPLPRYYRAAMVSISTPMLALVLAPLGTFLLAGRPGGRAVMFAVIGPMVLAGFIQGLVGFFGARRARDPKSLLRSLAGLFANGIWIVVLAVAIALSTPVDP